MVRKQRMPLISIPKPLREKLGDEGSDALIAVLNEQEKETENSVIQTAGLRFERKLAEEISPIRVDLAGSEGRFEKKLEKETSAIRVELTESEGRFEKKLVEEVSAIRVDLASLEQRFDKKLTEEVSSLRGEMNTSIGTLRVEMHQSAANNIKWMFLFWIGQIGVVTALFLKVA